MVLDSLRTMVIWVFSLALHWETFCYMQVIGFVLLLSGTVVYNAILRVPGFSYPEEEEKPADSDADTTGLLVAGDDYGFLDEQSINAVTTRSVSSPGAFAVRNMSAGGRG